MNIVRQWVVVVLAAYLLGTLGWCLTGGLRNHYPEPVEEIVGRGFVFVLVIGVLGGVGWYLARRPS